MNSFTKGLLVAKLLIETKQSKLYHDSTEYKLLSKVIINIQYLIDANC